MKIMQLPEAKRKIALNFTDVHADRVPTCGGIARTNCIPMGFSSQGSPSATILAGQTHDTFGTQPLARSWLLR
jgi:hypothetical protein